MSDRIIWGTCSTGDTVWELPVEFDCLFDCTRTPSDGRASTVVRGWPAVP